MGSDSESRKKWWVCRRIVWESEVRCHLYFTSFFSSFNLLFLFFSFLFI